MSHTIQQLKALVFEYCSELCLACGNRVIFACPHEHNGKPCDGPYELDPTQPVPRD